MYEHHLSSDGKTMFSYERFKDAAAALSHLGNVGEHLEPLLEMITPVKVRAYGVFTDELKGAVANFQPDYMTPVAEFFR